MSERMNKDRAIELLKNDCCYECSWGCRNPIECNNEECDYRQAIGIAIESLEENERLKKERDYILEKAKAELKDNDWVDVRDGLPSESGLYICTSANQKKIGTCFYGVGRDKKLQWEDNRQDIIAWKPLPQPYERKE